MVKNSRPFENLSFHYFAFTWKEGNLNLKPRPIPKKIKQTYRKPYLPCDHIPILKANYFGGKIVVKYFPMKIYSYKYLRRKILHYFGDSQSVNRGCLLFEIPASYSYVKVIVFIFCADVFHFSEV